MAYTGNIKSGVKIFNVTGTLASDFLSAYTLTTQRIYPSSSGRSEVSCTSYFPVSWSITPSSSGWKWMYWNMSSNYWVSYGYQPSTASATFAKAVQYKINVTTADSDGYITIPETAVVPTFHEDGYFIACVPAKQASAVRGYSGMHNMGQFYIMYKDNSLKVYCGQCNEDYFYYYLPS